MLISKFSVIFKSIIKEFFKQRNCIIFKKEYLKFINS